MKKLASIVSRRISFSCFFGILQSTLVLNKCRHLVTLTRPTRLSADPTIGMDPCLRSPGLLGTERDMPAAAPLVSPFAKFQKILILIPKFKLKTDINSKEECFVIKRESQNRGNRD